MIVTGLVAGIFAMIVSIMVNTDRHWQRGQHELYEHQEARRIVDTIAISLKDSSPEWNRNGTLYKASISDNNRRLDFYTPIFDADTGLVADIRKVTYKLNPDNEHELLVKTGTEDTVVLSGQVENIYFGGSCGCGVNDSMDCLTIDTACASVRIRVQTMQDNVFNLTSSVAMRNYVTMILSNSTGIDEPVEGEF